MTLKALRSLLIAFALTLCVGCAAQQDIGTTTDSEPLETIHSVTEPKVGTSLGDRIADFTVTTCDGRTVTLSEILKEKELVLINIWATWCGPCRMEFPFMEEVYGQYGDKVEILALSGDPSDTDAMIGEVAAELGLTFPMGRDSVGLAQRFGVAAFPTSILIDRFGTICLIEAGAQTGVDTFRTLFDGFLGEEYTESVVLDRVPAEIPTVELLRSETLSAALNADGGKLIVANDPDRFAWPMAVVEQNGRSVLTTTNGGVENSRSSVRLTVNAKAGEVLGFEYRISTETGFDYLRIYVDGNLVKRFSGEKDWRSYAYAFESDGEHTVKFVYQKDNTGDGGEDAVWLDNMRLFSGKDGQTALGRNPDYPIEEETSIRVTNRDARRITIEDPNGVLTNYFGGSYDAYILFEEQARFAVTLAKGTDPDAAIVYGSNSAVYTMAESLSGRGYAFSYPVDSAETTGVGVSYVLFFPSAGEGEMYPVLLFTDEENATNFILSNTGGAWEYAEEGMGAHGSADEVTYFLKFVDQMDRPVEGVVARVCNADSCVMSVSGIDGFCELVLPPYPYEVHILKLPEGYSADEDKAYIAPENGGELKITLTAENE